MSRSKTFHAVSASVAAALAVLASAPAQAHHMMGGEMPSTFAQGLLSGLGHPVIGLDHLAFIVGIGVVVGAFGLNLALPALFVAASAIGVAIHVAGVSLPASELVVAASVVLLGVLLARAAKVSPAAWAALFAVAGLFHGYAYGESIFGAEQTPLVAYLVGLVIIQSVIAVGVALATRSVKEAPVSLNARLAGAAVAGIGIAALAGQIIPG
ncbi:HupE/UreJ family protein [Xanthobacter tagetidis]|jgi:urease accessory protein|uniref:Urease accessory protein UreJ n=1 Tax=Xanthobacter tagetidis TaxID=60216 RepID=A0A3L6ZZU0_9HYPH|nr:HupE/UreJ family protein [Xanthobacter tagetidis]MBB6309454.1 urease accessory protein [Xanthobacter tagetidis]RLP73566.1 urease accessory protein UreJ [Xanthobacter tagetidis]